MEITPLSLREAHPELAKNFHPRLNDGKLSRYISSSSQLPYWWKCHRGPDHEWPATIAARLEKGAAWCPFCTGLQTSVTNSLALVAPHVAAQWHPELNSHLPTGPEAVLASSEVSVWWSCPVGDDHVWAALVAKRTGVTRAGPDAATAAAAAAATTTSELLPTSPHSHFRNSNTGSTVKERASETSALMTPLSPPLPPSKEGKENKRLLEGAAPPNAAATALTTLANPPALDSSRSFENGDASKGIINITSGGGSDGGGDAGGVGASCPCCAGLKASRTNSVETVSPAVAALWHPTQNVFAAPSSVQDQKLAVSSSSSSSASSSSSSSASSSSKRAPPTIVPPPPQQRQHQEPRQVSPSQVVAASPAPCVLRCHPNKLTKPHATSFPSIFGACSQASAYHHQQQAQQQAQGSSSSAATFLIAASAAISTASATDDNHTTTTNTTTTTANIGWRKGDCFFECRGCALMAARHAVNLVVEAAVEKAESRRQQPELAANNPFGADSSLVQSSDDDEHSNNGGRGGVKGGFGPISVPKKGRSGSWWRATKVRGKAVAGLAGGGGGGGGGESKYADIGEEPEGGVTAGSAADGSSLALETGGEVVKSEACVVC